VGVIYIKNLLVSEGVKAWKTMTEEPENKEPESLEKLPIDNPSDFQFHAAYLTYSTIYDKATIPETKKKLNENIKALQENRIDYPTFYRNISQYRTEEGSQFDYSRTFIKGQKKKEWRRAEQKHDRIGRHKR
jgi:hypothetical protein